MNILEVLFFFKETENINTEIFPAHEQVYRQRIRKDSVKYVIKLSG